MDKVRKPLNTTQMQRLIIIFLIKKSSSRLPHVNSYKLVYSRTTSLFTVMCKIHHKPKLLLQITFLKSTPSHLSCTRVDSYTSLLRDLHVLSSSAKKSFSFKWQMWFTIPLKAPIQIVKNNARKRFGSKPSLSESCRISFFVTLPR